MKWKIFDIILKRDNKKDDFISASDAYLKSTYDEQYTKEELKEKMIHRLKEKIKTDVRLNKSYITVALFSGYREKTVLPEVAEYFKTKDYKIDLLNNENYSNTNVLIINWQNREDFKND